jgi:pimeloyl-ACP methyl ester carboxylesterase
LYAGVRLALRVPAVIAGPDISLSVAALPWYAFLSTGRMAAAYLLSLLFSLVYGYSAARNRTAERVLTPLLDVLQSVPILSFLPVVLLGLSAVLPQGLAAELAPRFDTIRYQQRGLSPTTIRDPYTVESHVSDAIALMDELGIDRAWVIGHSWGGHLAMHVAVAYPQRLLGLVVVDGLGGVGDAGEHEFGQRLSAGLTPEQAARAEELDQRAMRGEGPEDDAIESLRIYWPYYFAHPEAAPPMPPMHISLACYGQTFDSLREHLAKHTLEEGLVSFRGAAIFIHGRHDPIPFEVIDRTASLIPGARVSILEDCGHVPWMEKPGAIRKALGVLSAPKAGIA